MGSPAKYNVRTYIAPDHTLSPPGAAFHFHSSCWRVLAYCSHTVGCLGCAAGMPFSLSERLQRERGEVRCLGLERRDNVVYHSADLHHGVRDAHRVLAGGQESKARPKRATNAQPTGRLHVALASKEGGASSRPERVLPCQPRHEPQQKRAHTCRSTSAWSAHTRSASVSSPPTTRIKSSTFPAAYHPSLPPLSYLSPSHPHFVRPLHHTGTPTRTPTSTHEHTPTLMSEL